ncbi:MAG: efflux RND transporter periplasmic adaptor subunit [Planctomycetaceae bacterium]
MVLNTPLFVLCVQPMKVEHTAQMDKHTKLLVDRGDHVDVGELLAGDVLCELDSSSLVEKDKEQQILVEQSSADVEKGRRNVEIQINQNLSDLAAASLKLELAQLDLRKFVEGEKIQQENEYKGEVLIAQEELSQADEVYQFYKRIAKKGYKSQVELETKRLNVVKARNKLAVQQDKLKVLQKYQFARNYSEFRANAEEAGRELKRVRLSGLAALAQFQADLRAKLLKYSVELEKLHRLQRQIAACRLVAPEKGTVVYANQRSRRQEQVVIEEGVSIRERQKIINLPDFSQMKVEAKIHESKISNVREGMPVKIRIDAIPDRIFNGVVEFVPDVSVRGEWPNMDLMLYETMIRITDQVSDLKPGMNAEVRIIAEERDNVRQVPIQTVIAVGDSHIAYVLTDNGPELRKHVKVGQSDGKMVEIISGLKEGERVIMNPKTHFGKEINELRAHAMRSKAKASAKAAGTRKPFAGGKPSSARKKGKRGKKPAGSWNAASVLGRLDKNKDGALTRDEVPSQMPFDRMDVNSDGKIDRAELSAAFRKRPAGGRP